MCFTFLGGDFMENRIKEYRKSLGLSQDDLAKECGVSRQTINAIENNKYDPSLVLAFQLSYVLGGTVDTIFMFRKNEEL
ncbi:HTH-type transcriptional regulator SinR [Brevibacillus laterosporus]|nr:HTH-type transcriptional regulator SinR [Brevibacillus laterosporus]